MPEPEPVEVSVVVPVYGCRPCLAPLCERMARAMELAGLDYELILVDDRSPDDAWAAIVELARGDEHVRGLRLSRNFGQSAAITAGLAESSGRWTVVMDCDLQEPPEAIPALYEKAAEGFDVVYSRRAQTRHSLLRRLASRSYFRLRNVILGTTTDTDHGTLSILSRDVVDSFLRVNDQHREYLALVDWLGFASTTIELEQSERFAGKSSYTWRRLIGLAVSGMFFQTTVLLRWIVFLGFMVAVAGCMLATYYLYSYAFDDPLPGYTSISVLLLVLSGIIIMIIGVASLYIGKVFEQVKGRPLFIVDRRTGGSDTEGAG